MGLGSTPYPCFPVLLSGFMIDNKSIEAYRDLNQLVKNPITGQKNMKQKIILIFLLISLIGFVGCRKKSPDEALSEAYMKFRQGDLIGARIDLKEILRKYPDQPVATDARFYLAQCYFAERDYTQSRNHALMLLEKFGPVDDRGKAAFDLILNTYKREGKFSEGIREATKFIKQLPPDDMFGFNIQCMISNLLIADNRTSEAISNLENLAENSTDNSRRLAALEQLVAIHAKRKDFDSAIKLYSDYAKKYPDYIYIDDLHAAKGFFYSLKGDKEKSDALFDQAINGYQEKLENTLDKNQKASFLLRQGKAMELMNKFDAAREKYDIILENYADTPDVKRILFTKGDSYFLEGDMDAALKYYQELLQKETEDMKIVQAARKRVARLMQEKARLAQAAGASSPSKKQNTPPIQVK